MGNHAPLSYDDAVRRLAESHRADIGEATEIFAFPDPQGKVVRLLEITPTTPPSGEVIVFAFRGSADFPFQSEIAQVTPGEWKQILDGVLPLPTGWELPRKRAV